MSAQRERACRERFADQDVRALVDEPGRIETIPLFEFAAITMTSAPNEMSDACGDWTGF
jgi:hypothetical protein